MDKKVTSSADRRSEVRIPWNIAVRINLLAKGKTIAELAEELHDSGFKYSRNYVSSVVYGRVISKDLHQKISDQLGIPDDDFITVTNENYANLLS